MWDDSEHKKPHTSRSTKKGTNSPEAAEAAPWMHLKDDERDRHRHL